MSWTNFRGTELINRMEGAVSAGVMDAAEAIGGVSQQQVPHDSGFLSRSMVIKHDPENKLNVAISYGGGAGTGFPLVPYAFKWHELEEKTTGRTFSNVNFQKGRKSNYLRDPVNIQGPRMLLNAIRNRMLSVI